MERKSFHNNVVKLQKEINNISYNINKVRYKNHQTMSNIVENLKKLSNNASILKDKNDETNKNPENILISYDNKMKLNNKTLSKNSKNKDKNDKTNKNNIKAFNNKMNNINIKKITKFLINNENNDDDILLSEKCTKNNTLNNYKKKVFADYINTNNYINKYKDKNNNVSKNRYVRNMPSTNFSYEKNKDYNNINNSVNPLMYIHNKSSKNNNIDTYPRYKLETNKIRFKLLKNIRDEIEDINFINDENKDKNIINNNKTLYLMNKPNIYPNNNNNNYYNISSYKKRSISNKNTNLMKTYNFNKNDNPNNQFPKEIKYKENFCKINILDKNINNELYNKTNFNSEEEKRHKKKIIELNNTTNNNNNISNKSLFNQNNFKNINNNDNKFNENINNDNLYNNKIEIQTQKNNDKDNINKEQLFILKKYLNLKGFSNLEELINWIKRVKQYKNFVDKIKNIYCLYNNNKNFDNNGYYNDIIFWINQNNNINKEYEIYCKEIMKINNLKDIKEFKIFMNQILNKNKKNIQFLQGMKKIFQNNFIPKIVNGKNYNDNY